VALIERSADDGVGARTYADLTRVGLRTRIAVVAARPVRLIGIVANAGSWIARPGNVALIQSRARDRRTGYARSCLADIVLRTGIAVGARRGVVRKDAPATRRIT